MWVNILLGFTLVWIGLSGFRLDQSKLTFSSFDVVTVIIGLYFMGDANI